MFAKFKLKRLNVKKRSWDLHRKHGCTCISEATARSHPFASFYVGKYGRGSFQFLESGGEYISGTRQAFLTADAAIKAAKKRKILPS